MKAVKRIIFPVLIIASMALIFAAVVFPSSENTAYAAVSIENSSYFHLFIDGHEGNYIEGEAKVYTFSIEINIGGSPLFYGTEFTVDGWTSDTYEKEIKTSGRYSYTVRGTGSYTGEIEVFFDVFIPLSSPSPNALSYTGQSQPLVSAGSAKGATFKYCLTKDGEYTAIIPEGTNAGSYTVYYAMYVGSVHSEIKSQNVTITKAPLKVRADELSIAHGSALRSVPVTYQGFINGESSESLTGEILLETDYTASSPLGDYQVIISGLSSVNYSITCDPSTLHCIEYNPEFTPPQPVEGLHFDGVNHNLLIPGQAADDAHFTYSTEENGLYSSAIPAKSQGGQYRIWYKVSTPGIICDYPQGYIDTEIIKPSYDMSGIKFEGESVVYDGELHKIEITGELPEGVTVEYENNSQTLPGTYTVKAVFTGSTAFNDIEPLTATLIIKSTSLSSETEPGDEPLIIIETPDGFDTDIRIVAEEKAKSSYSLFKYKKYGRMFARIYSVKIMRGDTVLNPSEISSTGRVKVRVLIPEDIDPYFMISVLNANSKRDIEEIMVDSSVLDGRYILLETDDINELILISSGTPFCYWHYILAGGIVLYLALFLTSYIKFRKKKFNAFNIALTVLYFALIAAAFFLAGTSCYVCLGLGIASIVLLILGTTLLALGHKKKPERDKNRKVYEIENEDIDFYRLIAEELNHSNETNSINKEESFTLSDNLLEEKTDRYTDPLNEPDSSQDSKETDMKAEELPALSDEITEDNTDEYINSPVEEDSASVSEETKKNEEVLADGNPDEISAADKETPSPAEETVIITSKETLITSTEEDDEVYTENDDDEYLESEIIDENGNKITIKYLKSYKAKLILSKARTKQFYSVLKNEILSYKNVKSRISWPAEKFRFGRNTIIMFKVTGNELTLYFDLDPKAYSESEYLVEDVSEIKTYASTPAMCKISAMRRLDNALKLIQAVMDKYGIKKEKGFNIDYTIGLREKEIPELIEQGLIREIRKEEGGVSPVMTAKLKTNPEKGPEIKK